MKSNLAGKFTWEVSQVPGGSEKFDFYEKSNFFFFLPTRHTSATLTATDPDRIVQRKKSPMHLYTGQVIEAPLLPGPAEVKKFEARAATAAAKSCPKPVATYPFLVTYPTSNRARTGGRIRALPGMATRDSTWRSIWSLT